MMRSDSTEVDNSPMIFEEQFEVSDTILGEGCSSVVKLCYCKHKKAPYYEDKYAVKIIRNPDEEYRQVAQKEFKILSKVHQSNIIKMHDVYYNEGKETLYLLMEHVDGVSLTDYVVNNGPIQESQAKDLFRQLFDGIFYLHTMHSICHRDLNSNNIIICENVDPSTGQKKFHAKIVDFNVSKPFQDKNGTCI